MNLHGLASRYISSVNPNQMATVLVSSGYTTQDDGTRVPTYTQRDRIRVQVQELSADDLHASEGLNLQGETKSIYLNGDWQGVVRGDARGGDLVIIDGRTWLVVKILENWREWTKVLAVRQMDEIAIS